MREADQVSQHLRKCFCPKHLTSAWCCWKYQLCQLIWKDSSIRVSVGKGRRHTRLLETIPKNLKYSDKVRVGVTVQLCMTVGNLGPLWLLSSGVLKCYWKSGTRCSQKDISFSVFHVSPFQLTFSVSVNEFKYPLVTHHSKVIVKNKAWSQNPWLFSSENSCLGSVSIVRYYVSAWGLICLQDSHECFVHSKVILEKVQFHIPVLLAVSIICPVVLGAQPEILLPFERLYPM